MVKVGDKFKEYLPSFVRGKDRFFSYELEVVGFKSESCGEFAECKETWENGRTDIVGIAIELLDNEKIYKKIS